MKRRMCRRISTSECQGAKENLVDQNS